MEKKPSKRVEILSILALIGVTMLWGGGFIFVNFTLEAGLSPAAVMFGRFALAAVVTGVFFGGTIRREYKKGQWKGGLVIGLILFGAFSIQTIALQYTTPANNAFITGVYVVLVPLIWWVITKKRPPAIMFVACAISFAGAAILAIDPAAGLNVNPGDALTLLGAALFAGHIVATGLLAKTIHPTVLVFMQFAVAAACSLVYFLATDRNFAVYLNKDALIGIGYLGLLSTCLCYFLQTNAQKHLDSAKSGIIMATEALFGALFSVLAGYDVLTVRMVVGGIVMFVSILIPELWAAKHPEEPNPEAPVEESDRVI